MDYKTESELCQAHIDLCRSQGWTAHPEFFGFDYYLVAPDGSHYGVEAKLRPSVRLLAQAADKPCRHGPDFVAVLVPKTPPDFLTVARHLGVIVAGPGSLPAQSPYFFRNPEVRPDPPPEEFRAAGTPSPVRLTRWKRAALELMATAAARGHVTREDFARLNLKRSHWTNAADGCMGPGINPGQWVVRPGAATAAAQEMESIKRQHPEVFRELEDRARRKL